MYLFYVLLVKKSVKLNCCKRTGSAHFTYTNVLPSKRPNGLQWHLLFLRKLHLKSEVNTINRLKNFENTLFYP
jgi:hypothetical protein